MKVQLDDPLPRFTLTRMKKDDGARYFGPFAHSGALRTTLELDEPAASASASAARCGPARTTTSTATTTSSRTAPPPASRRITPEEYRERVERACDFLGGKSRDLITALEDEMQKAAARLDFERAAELRDMIEDFKTTLKPARTFERGASMPRGQHASIPRPISRSCRRLSASTARPG